MPAAFIPSPGSGLWHIGPVPVRGYALCVLLGVVVCLWIAERRYVRAGGRPGFILDLAVLAVPFWLIGGRIYGVLLNPYRYFGHGHDWTDILRIWDGRFGLAGGVAAAAFCAWLGCRRAGVRLGPVAGAAAPGLAFAAALASAGNWFSQDAYGSPATVWWAVRISPEHRFAGYVNFATFQPTFLYQSAWDVLAGVMLILAARRFALCGDRLFALYAGLQAIGTVCTLQLQVGPAQRLFGLRAEQVVMILTAAGAAGYLYLTRSRHEPDIRLAASEPSADPVSGTASARG